MLDNNLQQITSVWDILDDFFVSVLRVKTLKKLLNTEIKILEYALENFILTLSTYDMSCDK